MTTYGGGTATITAAFESASGSFGLTVAPTTRTIRGVLTGADGTRGSFTLTIASNLAPVAHATSAQVSGVLEFPNAPADLPISGSYDEMAGTLSVSTISSGSVVFWLNGSVINRSVTGAFTGPGGATGSFSGSAG